MKARLLILGGVFFFSAVQWSNAQSAINQLGGQQLQDEFNQLHNSGQPQSSASGQQSGTGSAGGSGVSLTPAQQQAAVQAGGMAGNAIGNMLAQPAVPTTISYQQQQQIAARQLNNSGVYLLKQGDYAGAIKEFRQAQAKTPGDMSIRDNLKLAQQDQALAQAGDAKAAQTSSDLAKILGLPPAPGAGADTENSSYTTAGPGGSETGTPGASLLNLDGGASTLDSAGGAQPSMNTAIATPTATTPTPPPDAPQISSQADSILGMVPSSPGAGGSSAASTTADGAPAETATTTTSATSTPADAGNGSARGADQNLSTGTKVFGQPVSQPTLSDLNADSAAAGSGFDTQGKILGSGAVGMDSSVVDLRGKQGIVDPSTLKQTPNAPSTSVAGGNSYWAEVRQDLDQNGKDAVSGKSDEFGSLLIKNKKLLNRSFTSWEVGHLERKAWSDTLRASIIKNFDALEKAKDITNFASNYGELSKDQRIDVWMTFFMAIASLESDYDPDATHLETDGNISYGLFMVGYNNGADPKNSYGRYAASIGEPPLSELMDEENDGLQDPQINIRCGVDMFAALTAKTGLIAGGSSISAEGKIVYVDGADSYWSTLRNEDLKWMQFSVGQQSIAIGMRPPDLNADK